MTLATNAIKIVVSMVVVAALVATSFNKESASPSLRSRKLQSLFPTDVFSNSAAGFFGLPSPSDSLPSNFNLPESSSTSNFNIADFQSAGGTGGGASFGEGSLNFSLVNVGSANFANGGTTTSSGSAFSFVDLPPGTLPEGFGSNFFGAP